ncbi:MAG: DUF92 domain-containing protein [Ktedonobacteraceae bacterium]|nr:DUF92 domain-containing protein [Ktedonobacteraceae bacterium]
MTALKNFDGKKGSREPSAWLFKNLPGLLLGLLFSSGIGWLAYRRKALTRSGVLGAILSGTMTFGLGGWSWGLALIFFFTSSSLLSHWRKREKEHTASDKFSKGTQRDFAQATANGGVATLLALGHTFAGSPALRSLLETGYIGALATANADTWATELGVLSPCPPRLITTGAPVEPGTSGGVTPLGTAAGAAGALALGAFFRLLNPTRRAIPWLALIAGLIGSLVDSLLGATIQAMYYCPLCARETERRIHSCGTRTRSLRGLAWLNNDVVNFLATLVGSVTAMLLSLLYARRRTH